MRKEVIERIGMLDENFGLGYFEEMDYCYRARKAGYRLLVDQAAFVFHGGVMKTTLTGRFGGSQTMRTRPLSVLYHLVRNAGYLLYKHRRWRESSQTLSAVDSNSAEE